MSPEIKPPVELPNRYTFRERLAEFATPSNVNVKRSVLVAEKSVPKAPVFIEHVIQNNTHFGSQNFVLPQAHLQGSQLEIHVLLKFSTARERPLVLVMSN